MVMVLGETSRSKTKSLPPEYDGENPSKSFKKWLRDLKLWEAETDIPTKKHDLKIFRKLSGKAKDAVDDMDEDSIMGEDGKKNILNKLKEALQPHLDTSMPQAFEDAIYGEYRSKKTSMQEYTNDMERRFKELAGEGCDLPQKAQGYIMRRFVRLDEAQENMMLTWTEGKFDKNVIVKGLRKLEGERQAEEEHSFDLLRRRR